MGFQPIAQLQPIVFYPLYRLSGDFMSVLQDLISEAIPCQKCHMNMGPILSG
jgi:hypothetical protein